MTQPHDQESHERRHHSRVPMQLEVHCKSYQDGKIVQEMAEQTENISAGGMALRAVKPLKPEQSLLVSFFLPVNCRAIALEHEVSLPVIVRSRVAWCTRATEAYRVGIEFLDINPYSRKLFLAFLETYPMEETVN